MAIRIYTPEGQTPFTRRVRMENVETHIAARDMHADEAQMLREFAGSSDIPETLCEGYWRKQGDGSDERGDYVCYVEATTREQALASIEGYIHEGHVIYWADETSRWYVCDESDLDDLAALMDDEDEEIRTSAYSHWCAQTTMSDGFRREEEAQAHAEGELLTYRGKTDAGDISVGAATLEEAYEQAREEVTDEMIADGATLWIESPAGDRITLGVNGE